MSDDYFKNRNKNNTVRLRELEDELPEFCQEFFVGIESTTTPLTRLNYAYDLRIFFGFLAGFVRRFRSIPVTSFELSDLQRVTTEDIENFISYLSFYTVDGKEYSNDNRGKARKLSTVRAFFKYFYNKNKLENDAAAKIKMPKVLEKEIIRLEVDEVVNLLNTAESGDGLHGRQIAFHERTKLRDTALLTLFLGTGIRISECVGLNIDDIDFNVNGFTVTRKGGKRTTLYFSDEVAVALKEYLNERLNYEGVDESERALFLSLQKRRISTRAVQDLVKKYSSIVTPLKKITPHKLRSTYGTNLYRQTNDIYMVAEVLGHRDVNTTKKHYAATSDDIRRQAARSIILRDSKD